VVLTTPPRKKVSCYEISHKGMGICAEAKALQELQSHGGGGAN